MERAALALGLLIALGGVVLLVFADRLAPMLLEALR